jgi:pimeloyl-ACP methyl ester carboxylesterase
MTVLKWLLIIVAAVYVGGLALLYFKQRDMLFPIPPVGRTTPEAAGFPEAEEHFVPTADGEKIIIWHVPAKTGRPVVIFFHGNGDVLAGRVRRFKGITADGTGLVAVSFRGYAGSSGHPTEEALLQDGEAAYAFASERYPADRIIAWGFSLGTGVAVAVAAKHPVSKLILEAPYTSTADVAAGRFPIVPIRLLMRDQFHSDQRIGQVTAPLLIMHGTGDWVVPIQFGERLFALAHEPKQFVRIEGGGHHTLDDFGAIDIARRFIGTPENSPK